MGICEKCWHDAFLRAAGTSRTQTECYQEILAEHSHTCQPQEEELMAKRLFEIEAYDYPKLLGNLEEQGFTVREVLPEPGLSSNDISALEVKSCDAGHRIHRDGLVWLEAMDLLDRRACRAKIKEGK